METEDLKNNGLRSDKDNVWIMQNNIIRIKSISHLEKMAMRVWMEGNLSEEETSELMYSLYSTISEIHDISNASDPDCAYFRMWGEN